MDKHTTTHSKCKVVFDVNYLAGDQCVCMQYHYIVTKTHTKRKIIIIQEKRCDCLFFCLFRVFVCVCICGKSIIIYDTNENGKLRHFFLLIHEMVTEKAMLL